MLFLGDLPLPVHGMSLINQRFLERFSPKYFVNTAPSFVSFLFGGYAWLLFKMSLVPFVSIKIIISRILGEKLCYRSINGGIGQVYDIYYLLLLRLLGYQVYVHHHSFNYLNVPSFLFKLLLIGSGKGVVHIVLASRMKSQMELLYNVPGKNILVISNSVFFDKVVEPNLFPEKSVPTIGYMANLTLEKGLGTFVDLCEKLFENGIRFNALIAGPISGEGVSEKLERFSSLPNCDYLGPLYDDAKNDFFSTIDIFCFPSKYKNEAEPLVLYEAAQYGSALVVTETGCLGDVARVLGGASIAISDHLLDDLYFLVSDKLNSFSIESRLDVVRLFNLHVENSLLSLSLLEEQFNEFSTAR